MNNPVMHNEITHEDLNRVVDALHQVNLTLESLRVTMSTQVEEIDDHEKRLRQLERWTSSLTPVIASLIFLGGVISTAIISKLFMD